jgi:hypothetical protein
MLWEFGLPCSLCSLLGVCVQDCVEMVEIYGVLQGLLSDIFSIKGEISVGHILKR